jgi:hypothetical protein
MAKGVDDLGRKGDIVLFPYSASAPGDDRCMSRTARASRGGYCYHVLNRGNGRRAVFHKDSDFHAFVKSLHDAGERVPMRAPVQILSGPAGRRSHR